MRMVNGAGYCPRELLARPYPSKCQLYFENQEIAEHG